MATSRHCASPQKFLSKSNFPPKNFEQLRQLALLIKQGHVDLAIGKKSLAAFVRMVQSPDTVATYNIVELSEKMALSPASITRLAKLLGFHGYNAFQLVFKQKNKVANNFYSQSVAHLILDKKITNKTLFKQQLMQLNNDIEQCFSNEFLSLEKAKLLLAKKHRVFIFGYRQSSAVANILRYGLALIRPNVQMLVQADHGVAIALGQLKKDDLLVLISSAPYSNVTIKIATMAKQQGCQILSITDTALSPLNDLAEVALHISTDSNFYANSMVANCFFVENLLSITAIELGDTAIYNLQQHEQLLADLEVSG